MLKDLWFGNIEPHELSNEDTIKAREFANHVSKLQTDL